MSRTFSADSSASINSEQIWKMAGERPAHPLEAPCFTRHLLFRLMKEDNPRYLEKSDETSSDKREKWFNLTKSLTNIVNRFGTAVHELPNVTICQENNLSNKMYSIYSTIMIELRPSSYINEHNKQDNNQFRLRIRIDLYSESIGITIASDQFKSGDIFDKISNPKSIDDVNYIYRVWDQNPLYQAFDNIIKEHSLFSNNLIGDFRGLIYANNSAIGKESYNTDSLSTIQAFKKKLSGSAANPAESIAESSHSYNAILRANEENAHKIRDDIVSFFQQRGDIIDRFLENTGNIREVSTDSVLCSFLHGNALYCAPLASNRLDTGYLRCGIIKYIIVSSAMDGNQLGRLVRRLHILGELRYLALLDYKLEGLDKKDLKSVSNDLRHVGNELDKYVSNNKNNPILPMKLIEKVNLSLSKMSMIHDGSLMYRIEQSRYYANTFKDQIVDLRIDKIEGYQSYDQFIRRNVYQLFSKIDQIGRRYDALAKRIEQWIMMSEADASRKLLDNAENFATIFIVYYVGYISKQYFEKLNCEKGRLDYSISQLMCNDSMIHITEMLKNNYNDIWMIVLILVIGDVLGNDKEITITVYKILKKIFELLFKPIKAMVWLVKTAIDFLKPANLMKIANRLREKKKVE